MDCNQQGGGRRRRLIHNPQKARVLLALAINEGADMKKVESYFNPYK